MYFSQNLSFFLRFFNVNDCYSGIRIVIIVIIIERKILADMGAICFWIAAPLVVFVGELVALRLGLDNGNGIVDIQSFYPSFFIFLVWSFQVEERSLCNDSKLSWLSLDNIIVRLISEMEMKPSTIQGKVEDTSYSLFSLTLFTSEFPRIIWVISSRLIAPKCKAFFDTAVRT